MQKLGFWIDICAVLHRTKQWNDLYRIQYMGKFYTISQLFLICSPTQNLSVAVIKTKHKITIISNNFEFHILLKCNASMYKPNVLVAYFLSLKEWSVKMQKSVKNVSKDYLYLTCYFLPSVMVTAKHIFVFRTTNTNKKLLSMLRHSLFWVLQSQYILLFILKMKLNHLF